MSLIKVVLGTLAFTILVDNVVVSSPRSGPNGNQYKGREGAKGGGQPLAEMSRFHDKDATDRGLMPSKHRDEEAQGNSRRRETPEGNEKNRNKRSYYPYPTNSYLSPQFQSINVWRPSLYPVQRPYYVPIYGIDGRIPIYLAPQPWYINPGTPPKNPTEPPYVGPTYLPPVTPKPTYLPPPVTPTLNETTTMPTDDRFGGNDDDDRPIWDNGNESPTTAKPSIAPTRKPAQAGEKTFPPLVHGGGSGSSTGAAAPPTTTAPPPEPLPGPSRCVWAIVSCCSTSSSDVSYRCFDQLGCSGPFWDVSPCETEYARAAIQAALNYYNSRA